MKPLRYRIQVLGVLLVFAACTPMTQATSQAEDSLRWEDGHLTHTEFSFTFEGGRFWTRLGPGIAPFGLTISIYNDAPVSKKMPARPAISMIRLHDGVRHLADVEMHRDAKIYFISLPDTPRTLRIEINLGSGALLYKTVHISPKLILKRKDEALRFPLGTFRGNVSGSDKDLGAGIFCLPRPEEGAIEQMDIMRLDLAAAGAAEHESLVMRVVAKQPLTAFHAIMMRNSIAETAPATATGVKYKFTCRTQNHHYELIQAR